MKTFGSDAGVYQSLTPLEKGRSYLVTAWVKRLSGALAVEAYRLSRSAQIVESPDDLDIGGRIIPSARASGRLMRIRYAPPYVHIPRISLKDLIEHPGMAAQVAGKVVFAGVTDQTAARDWLFTPYSAGKPMV